jgi:hypothetical protein
MDNSEALFILSFLFILLSLIVLMRFFLIKSSSSASFIFHKRAKRIRWIKVFKYWFFCQLFFAMSKFDQLYDNIIFVLVTPIFLICFLLIYGLFYDMNTLKVYGETEEMFDQKEYEDYEKSFNRQKRINKIIKRF